MELSRKLCVLLLFLLAVDVPLALAQPSTSQTSKDIRNLRSEMENVRKEQAAAREKTDAIAKKLDDTGWKALDFASQLSSAQWAMFGTGLAFMGLVVAVLGLGAYQGVLKAMQINLESAATRLEERLTAAIAKEEERLRAEFDRRIESIKTMMEDGRQRAQALTYGSISFAFWDQHNEISGATSAENDEKCRNLEAALHLSNLAIDCAAKAGEGNRELLTSLRSNRAYYFTDLALLVAADGRLAKHFSADRRNMALELANDVRRTAKEFMTTGSDANWPEWLETACWVYWNLGDEDATKNALLDLRTLYEHKRADREMKEWIRKRYFKNDEPAW